VAGDAGVAHAIVGIGIHLSAGGNVSNGVPVFVIPHYGDGAMAEKFLDWTLAGLRAQTDPEWRLVIVDDASPDPSVRHHLRERVEELSDRATLIARDSNSGQGVCRNVAVAWAADHGAPFVLFNDADDVSHPRRLEVTRELFDLHPETGFIYSTFVVVDENGQPVPRHALTPSVAEILDSHHTPVEGRHGWIVIGTETGYTSLTSTVAIRTDIAERHPFPPRGSEDQHTWLRVSAATCMRYAPSIPSQYRIPQQVAGSADRARMGDAFYQSMAELDLEGFLLAAETAVAEGAIDAVDVPALRRRFLERTALTFRREQLHELAEKLLSGAYEGVPSRP
jgi:hypothetical protein